jgi:DNA-binding GntR family transcriptional regulator
MCFVPERLSKPRLIADAIEAQIRSGEYATGGQLPGRHELARTHQTSVDTLSAAITELEARGLLVSRPSTGTYVVDVLPAPGRRAQTQEERIAALEADVAEIKRRLN